MSLVLPFAVEDVLFFKDDARDILKQDSIILKCDFEIITHNVTGINDMTETFTLKISNEDRDRLVNELKISPYLRDTKYAGTFWESMCCVPSKKVYCDNEQVSCMKRQAYQKQEGYISEWDIIRISKSGNTLSFERINE